jgi:hypothetical protein
MAIPVEVSAEVLAVAAGCVAVGVSFLAGIVALAALRLCRRAVGDPASDRYAGYRMRSAGAGGKLHYKAQSSGNPYGLASGESLLANAERRKRDGIDQQRPR